jgi:hypothetical protein
MHGQIDVAQDVQRAEVLVHPGQGDQCRTELSFRFARDCRDVRCLAGFVCHRPPRFRRGLEPSPSCCRAPEASEEMTGPMIVIRQ